MFLKKIEDYGREYERELINTYPDDGLISDWWSALEFVFSRTFMRGRSDKLSNMYLQFTLDVLKKEYKIDMIDRDESFSLLKQNEKHYDKQIILNFIEKYTLNKKNSIKHENFQSEVIQNNPIIEKLVNKKRIDFSWGNKVEPKEIHLGNQEDVMMVLDILKITAKEKNIYSYIKEMINDKGLNHAYVELNKIRAIADKISTFVLRDICMNDRGIKVDNYEYVFPIDTWVSQIALKINCTGSPSEVKHCLITKCKNANCDPMLFAVGLWYVGFHSLDILLNMLLNQ